MTEVEELLLAYVECARQRNELLVHRKNDAERIRVLREALELIHGQSGNDYAHDIFEARAIARAALEATK